MISRFRMNGGYEKWDQWAEWPMVALAVIFLCALILPLSTTLTPTESLALARLNLTLWALFALEYLTRLYLSLGRRAFVRTHIFDLLIVAVPFFRPFRLIRVISLLVSSGRRAGGLVVRQVLAYVVCLTAIVMSICALIVYHSERSAPGGNIHSISDAFWWALTTTTTVGYGDRFPVTATGRVTAAILMVTGIALVGTITAAVAAGFVHLVRSKPSSQLAHEVEFTSEIVSAKIDHLTSVVERLEAEIRSLRPSISKGEEFDAGSRVSVDGAELAD